MAALICGLVIVGMVVAAGCLVVRAGEEREKEMRQLKEKVREWNMLRGSHTD